jgi:TonB family protein
MIQAEGVDTLKKQVLSMTKLIRSTVLRQNPNYPPSYMDELEKKFAEHVKETDIEDLAIPVYAKAFSVDELKQILAFRLSPVGRKVAFSQPEIVAGIVRASALYTQQIIPEIKREVVADHPEWKKQLEEANSPPSLISKVDPQIPKGESPKSGAVVLSIVIDENGVPQDAQVVGSLDAGFDEKAVEAVQKWRFIPSMKGGVPVKTRAKVEVNFRVVQKP